MSTGAGSAEITEVLKPPPENGPDWEWNNAVGERIPIWTLGYHPSKRCMALLFNFSFLPIMYVYVIGTESVGHLMTYPFPLRWRTCSSSQWDNPSPVLFPPWLCSPIVLWWISPPPVLIGLYNDRSYLCLYFYNLVFGVRLMPLWIALGRMCEADCAIHDQVSWIRSRKCKCVVHPPPPDSQSQGLSRCEQNVPVTTSALPVLCWRANPRHLQFELTTSRYRLQQPPSSGGCREDINAV